MTARGNSRLPWIQPILVAKEGEHADTILCGALASLGVWLHHPDHLNGAPEAAAIWSRSTVPASNFDNWLSGPFGKTTRRMSMRDLSKFVLWCTENGVPFDSYEIGDSCAVAVPPLRYEELPKPIAKAQVSGTDFSRGDTPVSVSGLRTPFVTLRVDDSLTTGKATAQAAHALWLWALAWLDAMEGSDPVVRARRVFEFLASGPAVRLELVPGADLANLERAPRTAAVRDAGFTEVAPSTLTAIADWRGQAA